MLQATGNQLKKRIDLKIQDKMVFQRDNDHPQVASSANF